MTSVEFTAAAARALSPGGLFAINIGDGPPLAHARARVAAVRSVFPHVCVIADPGVLRGRRFGNLVVAGSRQELPVSGLVRLAAADPFPGRVVHGAELDRFTRERNRSPMLQPQPLRARQPTCSLAGRAGRPDGLQAYALDYDCSTRWPPACWTAVAGNWSSNVAPWPTRTADPDGPSMASAIALTIARPKPNPPAARFGRHPRGEPAEDPFNVGRRDPGPESLTVMTIASSSCRAPARCDRTPWCDRRRSQSAHPMPC